MAVVKDCKFYLKGGRCTSKDAPNPGHSRCIGKVKCTVGEKKEG